MRVRSVAPWALAALFLALWLVSAYRSRPPATSRATRADKPTTAADAEPTAAAPAPSAAPRPATGSAAASPETPRDPATRPESPRGGGADDPARYGTTSDESDPGRYGTTADDTDPGRYGTTADDTDPGGYGTTRDDPGTGYGTTTDPTDPGGYGTTRDDPGTGYGTVPDDDPDLGEDPTDTTGTVGVPREVAYAFSLFDGFEHGNGWAIESAADHATLAVASRPADGSAEPDPVSEGRQALRADFEARGKGNFELRREVKLDLTKSTTFRVDVLNQAGPLDLVLGFRAGLDTTLFTSPPTPLAKGWNRDVELALADVSAAAAGDTYAASWNWSRDGVSRVSLIFRERGQAKGTVFIDNLRFDHAATQLALTAQPVLKKIIASTKVVERYEPIELVVDFQGGYQDFFDRAQIDVQAAFYAPSGKRLVAHAFVYDTDVMLGRPVWKVRFTPTEVGIWRYDVTVKDASGQDTSATYPFSCVRKADRRGFVRVSKADPRYFERDDGSFYYPIGQNVCWASKYGYFLEKMRGYGGNYVRVWLCPWNLQLEDPTEPGKYDLRVAKQLDELLDLCRRNGIYVQLVLRYHGMQSVSWAKNPYNSANDGPCYSPGEFFTNATAMSLHKQFLDYVVARWGYSPAVFAWELWNEADLARADAEADLVAWHKEMANYLKQIDVNKHLVTTSVATPGRVNALFELANIDFVPVHFYARNVYKKVHESCVGYRKLRKPIFVGEFSGGHQPADDLADPRGVRIHAGLWLAFTSPMAGSAMPWWWDTYVDKNDLYGHWRALVDLAKGHDRRGKDFELVRSTIRLTEHASVTLQGIVAPSEAYLWIFDERRIPRAEQADRPLLPEPRPVALRDMLGGRFEVVIWDTHEGKALSTSTVATTADGVLRLELPACNRDIAVKVTKVKAENGAAGARVEW